MYQYLSIYHQLPPGASINVKHGPMLCAPIKRGLSLEEDEKKHPFMDTGEDGMPARLAKVKNGVSFTITVTDVFVVPFVQLCKELNLNNCLRMYIGLMDFYSASPLQKYIYIQY